MIRIAVISDTHGRPGRIEQLYRLQRGADLFIHLGDGLRDVEIARAQFPEMPLIAVAGNCDLGASEPNTKLIEQGGARILATHGHRYHVKSGLAALAAEANSRGAKVVLFGHTHQAMYNYRDGVHYLNPGSAGKPADGAARYGIVDITPQGIVCNLAAFGKPEDHRNG